MGLGMRLRRLASGLLGRGRSVATLDDARAAFDAGEYALMIPWLQRAAGQGLSDAHTMLGFAYLQGNGVPEDFDQGVAWLKSGAELGDPEARKVYGTMLLTGQHGGPPEPERGLVMMEKVAAERDEPTLCEAIGTAYWQGRAGPPDPDRAEHWYRRAAKAGNPEALYGLALDYDTGHDVPRDQARALEIYRDAAAQDSMNACHAMAVKYREGDGVEPDMAEALAFYRKAAQLGSARSMIALGELHATGEHVPQDDAEAFRWYEMAAVAGDPEGCFRAGLALVEGAGTITDIGRAAEHFQEAAERGHAEAMGCFGLVLVDHDRGVAHAMMSRGRERTKDPDFAAKMAQEIEALEPRMSDEEMRLSEQNRARWAEIDAEDEID